MLDSGSLLNASPRSVAGKNVVYMLHFHIFPFSFLSISFPHTIFVLLIISLRLVKIESKRKALSMCRLKIKNTKKILAHDICKKLFQDISVIKWNK